MAQKETIETAEDISNLAFGFMASKALFTALHLDVFAALAEGPKPTADLAAATGVDEDQLITLLTALATSGLLILDEGRYANTEAAAAFLVPGQPYYFGDYLQYQIDRQMFPVMSHLTEAIRGKYDRSKFADYEDLMADPEEARLFSDSQHYGSLGPARSLLRKVDLSVAKSFLDVGGGSGAFAIVMAQKHPALHANIIDFPNVEETANGYIAEAGLADRISFIPGNALETNWPGGQDAILMSYLFSGVGGNHFDWLADTAFERLNPGGAVIVHDFMVEDDRSGPKLAALWQLQHMVFTPSHVSLTPAMLATLLARKGFEIELTDELIPGMTKVVVGRKPS